MTVYLIPARKLQRNRDVTRIRNEQPRSAGAPTPLPRISTLCVLPRPPGMSSVLSARRARFAPGLRRFSRASTSGPAGSTSGRGSRASSGPSASAAARTLVKSTCAVMSCSPGCCSHGGVSARRFGARHRVPRERRQRAAGVRRRVELARLVAVVDEDDEAAPQAPRRVADPVDRAQVDLDAPAGLERDAEPIEILGERRRRRRTLNE